MILHFGSLSIAMMLHNLKERLFFGSSPNDSGACIFARKSNGHPLRRFTSHFTDSLYTVGNKLLEKYIRILGHVNHCRFMVLVAFSLASHCSGWTLGCFSVAHQYHYLNAKTSSDIYANQELHNIHGAYKFYTH